MSACKLCPRQCGVDRSKVNGACRVGEEILIGAVVIHRGEEPPLVTGSGSGAIFFCGCPLKCTYCQNKQISQLCRGKKITTNELAESMVRLQDAGCSNINLVSPTHYTPRILDALESAREQGLRLPIVVNSSGYETRDCMKLWKGYAHIFLMDLKYGDNHSGEVLSAVADYWDRAREAISFLWETAGPLKLDQEARAVSGLIVRHLLLPTMLSNPFSVLEFLSGLSSDIPLSLMSQYNPCYYQADIPEMRRSITQDEYQVVLDKALELGFTTVFSQDMESPSIYNPDFDSESPFGDLMRLY
jgi:putative pyruvate formate lyase activating enzyme